MNRYRDNADCNEAGRENAKCRLEYLIQNYTDSTYAYAQILTKGNVSMAEELTQQAFFQTYHWLLNHPEPIHEPQGWLHKAVLHCFLNSKRSKMQQSSISLEQYQKGSESQRESPTAGALLTREFPAPEEDEPAYIVETGELEAEQSARFRAAILATSFDTEVKALAIHHLVDRWTIESIAHTYRTTPQYVKYAIQRCLKEINSVARKRIDEEGRK